MELARNSAKQWLAVVLILILGVSTLPLPGAEAATTVLMNAKLPSGRDGTSAVGADDAIYIFGGDTGGAKSDEILRYDPRTDTLTDTGAKFPTPRTGTSAVWTGQYAYIIGGWIGSPYLDEIVRYDPDTNTVQVMSAKLPSARTATSAVWTGQHIYIFGGTLATGLTTAQILRYDPATDTIATMSATLPSPRYQTSAVWDGTEAYIFGGYGGGSGTNQIVRYNPTTNSVSVLAATLPTARYATSAVLVGSTAYVYGGHGCGGLPCNSILEFDTGAETIGASSTTLTSGRIVTSAAYFARNAYIIGGFDGTKRLDEILRHGPLAPNSAPVLSEVTDATVQATTAYNLTVTATDADNDLLTFSATGAPTGASFTDHGDGSASLDWSPAREQVGLHTITITVSDGETTDADTFTINVTEGPDRAPVIAPIADQEATARVLFTLGVSASDEDADPITLALPIAPTGATFTDHGDGTGTIEWTPTRDQGGVHGFTLEAIANGVTVSENFTVNVTVPPNGAPTITAIPDQASYVGAWLNLTITASDPDGDPVTLTFSPLPASATFTQSGGVGELRWEIQPGQNGTYAFDVNATDGAGYTVTNFTAVIYRGPEPQVHDIEDRTVTEGETLQIPIFATDPLGGNLTMRIDPQPLPFGASFSDLGGGSAMFTWSVAFDAAPVYIFTVTADNGERSGTGSFTVTVEDVDRPPAFDPITAVRGELGSTLTKTITASDPDATPVTITALSLPAGATLTSTVSGSATIDWANAGPAGTYTALLQATSNGRSVTATVPIQIVPSYAFSLSVITPSPVLASPGETLNITFRIANTGFRDDTYRVTAFDAAPSPQGGFAFTPSATAPAFVAVGDGETLTYNVQVTVPGDASSARPRVLVQSTLDTTLPVRQLNWLLAVPVVIKILPEDATPTALEQNILVAFNGTVNITFRDGTPVANMAFTARHTLQGILLDTITGTVDENGTWAFDGLERPTFGLPGDHQLTVSVTRRGRTDTAVGTWSVGAA